MIRTAVAIFVIFFSINTLFAQGTDLQENQVLEAFDGFLNAFEALDDQQLLHYISKDKTATLVLGNTIYKGSAVRDYFETAVNSTKSFDSLKVSNIKVEPLEKGLMMLSCSFFEKYTLKSRIEPFSFDGAAMYIFRKEQDTWRILHAAGGGVFK